MRMSVFSVLATVIFVSGCAVGPLVSHETARTVGDNSHELLAGYGQAGYVAKWNYGITENLDVGLHWEMLSLGLRAKYAWLNASSGWSLATAIGAGESMGGSHYYGDLIGSYATEKWEPYGTVRIVRVKNDPIEFKDVDTGYVDLTIDKSEFTYGQFMLGTRYWFTPNWLLSLEATSLFKLSPGLHAVNPVLAGASLGYRF